jgi:hypothetical protein
MFVCFCFASLGCAVVLFQNENCTDKHKHSRRFFGFPVPSMKENPKILLFYTNQPPFLVKHFACEIQQARQTRKINERRYNKQDNKQDKHPSKTESSATMLLSLWLQAADSSGLLTRRKILCIKQFYLRCMAVLQLTLR